MQAILPFNPTGLQWEIMCDPHRFKTLVCGRRTGKSVLCINFLVYYALLFPGQYWYLATTYNAAKRNAWDEIKARGYIPDSIIESRHETDMVIRFFNGSVIRFMGVDNRESLRGAGLSGVVLDEYQDFDDDIFPLVIRPMLSDMKGFALFAGTPKGKGNVLYSEFIKDEKFQDPEHKLEDGSTVPVSAEHRSFKFHTEDNPFITLEEITAAKNTMSEDHFNQEYRAEFVNYTGIIYKEFNTAKHVKEIVPQDVAKDNIYIGIDTGQFTAVGFCALGGDGRWKVFDELYVVDGIVEDICKRIKEKLADWNINPARATFIIDAASQHKREYIKNGIYVIDGEKDVLGQIDNARTKFIKPNGITINTCCTNLISELKGYIWSDKKVKKAGRQPKKEHDHMIDGTLHYVIGSSYVAKPFLNKSSLAADDGDSNEVMRKLGVLSDEYEIWEDENQVEYQGTRAIMVESRKDPVTGY